VAAVDNETRPVRVIVSGGIGSGKSTVLGVLAGLGAVVIEADQIGRDVLEPDGAAFSQVAARWPQVIVGGRVDRSRLAAIVFSDPEQLRALEAISHPLIAAEIESRVAAAGNRDVVLELPLSSALAGPGWFRVVVDAPRQVRLDRAVGRGMDVADVVERMDAQPERDELLSGADTVIDNSGSVAELEARVRELWSALKGGS